MSAPRLRFAPSPTGYLHIGGVRTALYCWLWARQQQGQFILRVEDTDQDRNSEEAEAIIYDGMRWLGLHWDEGPDVGGPHGPYRQSERSEVYQQHLQKLLDAGHAYRCYSTAEERDALRAAFVAKGNKPQAYRFASPWRDRTDGDPSQPHVVRFRVPAEGATQWDDLVRGGLSVGHREIEDFVLARANGVPLYNFACVVDDLSMGVTHVVRGEDHIINTPKQILLYAALGAEAPHFAHLPMILNQGGKKMSKRDGTVSVTEYRDEGYLPDAVLNYLARLGWSHGDQEIFSRQELIEKFGFDHVGKVGAKYDLKKFLSVQSEHLRLMEPEAIAEAALPFVRALGLKVAADDPRLVPAFRTVRPRASTLKDAAQRVAFYFQDAVEFDPKATKKFLKPAAAEHLSAFTEVVQGVDPFDEASLETAVTAWMERTDRSMKQFAQAVRVSLTGSSAAPGLYEVMAVLGKDVTLKRLAEGQSKASAAAE